MLVVRHTWAERLRQEGRKEEAAAVDLPPWKTFDIRPHDLRHSYCTMLRDAGVDMKQAMEWMGHADEKMILRIYDHLSPGRAQKSKNQVEKMLSSCQSGCQDGASTLENLIDQGVSDQ